MNTCNPFQIPSCFQIDHERRRRERFKKTFIAIVAAGTLLMIGLLIEGSISERARAADTAVAVTEFQGPAPNPAPAAETPNLISLPQVSPHATALLSAPTVPKANTSAIGHAKTIYVVKPGDNLTRIAKTQGTTVKAIQTANGLASDRLVIGVKLKIPAA
jgi:LysM repeat protein